MAIVVSIGLDHQAILGDTCEAIGVEKAGVMRRGKPVVFGAGQMPDSVRDQAARLDAPLLRYGRDYDQLSVADGWQVRLADGRVVRSTVAPQVPAVNAAAALQAFALLEPQFEDGAVATACRNAFAPGRLERVRAHDRLWLLDVGHNGQAARFLAASLRQPAQCAIVGMFEDKDHVAVAAALSARVRHWIATNNCLPRGLAADELARRMAAVAPRAIPRLDDAVAAAIENTRKGDVILAFSSFDIVARVRAHLLC